MALVFYYKDVLEKVTMQRNQQFSAFLAYRTQLNAAHAQLLEKLGPIAHAETCRFLTMQWLEFQEIWQKKFRNHVKDLKVYKNMGQLWSLNSNLFFKEPHQLTNSLNRST